MLTLNLKRRISLTTLTTFLFFFLLLFTTNAFAAPIKANPTQGPVGTKVTVSGTEWPPNDLIKLSWNFAALNTVNSVRTDGNGAFSTNITVPKGAPAGKTYINAINEAGKITGQAPFNVTASNQTQPAPGWYKNSKPATIYKDTSGLKIVWENSYIYQHPGHDNLYWYAQIKYLNSGTKPLTITCVGRADPSLAREHIRGTEGIPPNGDGYVPVDETFCKRNPMFTGSINPGGTHYEWAIFHNVPPGGQVSLEWGPYPYSPSWVNPWYSPFSAPSPTEFPPELQTYPYGAFAYSPAKHSVVTAGWGQDPVSAEDIAIAQCRQRAKDCLPVTWYRNAYASFAVGNGAGNTQTWGSGHSGVSTGDADERALSTCRTFNKGMQCSIVLRYVTSSPSPSAQAGVDLVGRVCMVFAPNGADFGIFGKYGHVGWAYLIDRNYGTWAFGANEGPTYPSEGTPSNTWHTGGYWPSLVKSFKANENYHKANYYQYVRCSSGPWHNSKNAAAAVNTQQQKPYWVHKPGCADGCPNDCLSNVVDVFRAYGVPNLPSYINTWQPNTYFNIELNKSSFEPARKIELR